ncbi:MAG: helix-turn-helix domain-containing protein [Clostridia bacterium]|nr:helix-turn-helix domain-containing protein [Clostridia bacterium]
MDNLKLNDTICFYRKKQGLTQEELAVKLGVTNQSVSKWESAQCCPDISLIPKLADIFDVSIDELFGKEPKPTVNNYDLCTEFPWPDDNTLRVVFARGRKILDKSDNINECISIRFPHDCNETTRQYFKVEVLGNISCDASINGDVVSHGKIECNQINGDIKECKNNISCKGAINGDVNADGNVGCGDSISGNVSCGENVACGDGIGGKVNCGGSITCGDGINGDVKCGGNIECKKIEGDVECQGNIIYK